ACMLFVMRRISRNLYMMYFWCNITSYLKLNLMARQSISLTTPYDKNKSYVADIWNLINLLPQTKATHEFF
ncbi:MAG: hypothetical protein R6U11_03040, partial [Bacteroidales bacterium]